MKESSVNDAPDNEEYLKIYYPSTSSTAEEEKDCIEVPVDDKNGSILFADIKALDPNIFALNLTRNKVSRLLKPMNGCFNEPKEKWSSFKIVAVLKDSCSTTTSSNNNDSSRKTSITSELRLPSCSTPCVAPTTRIPVTSKAGLDDSKLRSTTFTLAEYIATKEQTIVPLPRPIDPSPPSLSISTSFNPNQSLSSLENNTGITDAEVFAAYNVSSFSELRELLCYGNVKFFGCFTIIFVTLKRTLIAHPDKDIIKLIYYAYQSFFDLKILHSNALDFCQICNKRFTLRHLVSKGHIMKYQSKYKKDPPEISLILDFKNRAQIITYALLMNSGENPFDFFVNKFYPEMAFNAFKNNLVSRITTAQLKLSFEDPLLFEKLLFLSENVNEHPKLNDLFPENYFCKNCDILLLGVSSIVYHLFTELHICTSLTQNQLNKLIEAVSIIDYSADDRSRKRDLQETAAETSVKRQRRTFYF